MSTAITPPAPNKAPIDYDAIRAQSGATNDDALAKYSPTVQSLAKQLSDYTLKVPGGSALRPPTGVLPNDWMTALVAAKEYDPTFDQKQYDARQKLLTNFGQLTPNTTGGTIASSNRIIGHIGELADAAKQLHNRSVEPWNYLANEIGQATDSDGGALNRYTTTQKAIADEATKFFRGSSGTEADIQSKLSNLSPSLGPVNQQVGMEALVGLMAPQLYNLREGYKKTMGRYPAQPLLTDEARGVLQKMGYDPDQIETKGVASKNGVSALIPGTQPATDWKTQAANAKAGDVIPLPNGHKVQKNADGTFTQLTK